MYKLEFKLSLPLMLTSLPLVVMFLLFIAGGYEFYQELNSIDLNKQEKVTKEEKVFKLDLQASMALENKLDSIKGLGVDSAELYMLKIAKKKRGLESLFSKLKKKANNKIMRVKRNTSPSKTEKSMPNYDAFLSNSEKTAMNDKAIREIIHSKKHLFKACYNKMLLKDGLLSGIATITINSNRVGSSSFKGIGRTKVIKKLKSCLNSQTHNIDLSSINLTKSIRFSLNFSS